MEGIAAAILALGAAMWARIRIYGMVQVGVASRVWMRVEYLGIQYSLPLPRLRKDTDRLVKWYERITPQKRDAFLAAAPRILALARKTRWHAFSLRVVTEDAARAAMWHGALHMLGQALCLAQSDCRTEMGCRCAGPGELRTGGVVSWRMGQILLGGIYFAAAYYRRRIRNGWAAVRTKMMRYKGRKMGEAMGKASK